MEQKFPYCFHLGAERLSKINGRCEFFDNILKSYQKSYYFKSYYLKSFYFKTFLANRIKGPGKRRKKGQGEETIKKLHQRVEN